MTPTLPKNRLIINARNTSAMCSLYWCGNVILPWLTEGSVAYPSGSLDNVEVDTLQRMQQVFEYSKDRSNFIQSSIKDAGYYEKVFLYSIILIVRMSISNFDETRINSKRTTRRFRSRHNPVRSERNTPKLGMCFCNYFPKFNLIHKHSIYHIS